MELSFPRTFAPKSESTIGGTFAPWYFRSLEHSFPGTFAPESESYMEHSLPGTFAPRNFRSQELSFPGTFVPWYFRSRELSFPGTFAPSPLNFRPVPIQLKKRITLAPSSNECSSLPTNVALRSVLASRHVRLTYDDDMVSAKITKS